MKISVVKNWLLSLLTSIMITLSFGSLAFAQNTVLPEASKVEDCAVLIEEFNLKEYGGDRLEFNQTEINNVLGCAIVTGKVSLVMLPHFIRYFSNYLLGMVSLVSLLFVAIGGFMYTTGGISEQKDTGKNFIKNALIGMVLAFMSWTIVNVILLLVTR